MQSFITYLRICSIMSGMDSMPARSVSSRGHRIHLPSLRTQTNSEHSIVSKLTLPCTSTAHSFGATENRLESKKQ